MSELSPFVEVCACLILWKSSERSDAQGEIAGMPGQSDAVHELWKLRAFLREENVFLENVFA